MVLFVKHGRAGVPVVRFATNVSTSLEQKNFLSGWSQVIRKGATSGTAAYDDHVIMIVVGHGRKPRKLAIRCAATIEVTERVEFLETFFGIAIPSMERRIGSMFDGPEAYEGLK
jgi:hypothetical protein